MDLPNEVTLHILSFMPKMDIKQARLVCRLWAALGGQSLFDTIYVSPRETDMVVFESITQHTTLRNAPRHLVYDSTIFEQYDEEEYAWNIHWQYHNGTFDVLGDALFAIQEMVRYIPHGIVESTAAKIDTRLKSHPLFNEGFREYSKHANEYRNIFTKSWSARVYQGLSNLGPIVSLTIRNTWEMIYDDLATDLAPQGYDNGTAQNKYQPIRPSNKGNTASLISRNRIRPDGTRSIGSPSARAYSATALQPYTTQDWNINAETQVMITGTSTGNYEFHGVVNLLSSAGKRPRDLKVVGGMGIDPSRTGIAAHVFDPMQVPEPTNFLDLASGLTILHLKVTDTIEKELTSFSPPNIQPLRQFLRRARSLEVLLLDLPGDLTDIDMGVNLTPFNFCPIFSEVQPWLPTGLRELELNGFSASYRELSTHLCLCLPNLTTLTLGNFLLKQGSYEDLFNGLQNHARLETYVLNDDLYNSDGSRFLPPHITMEDDEKQNESLAISEFFKTGKDLPNLERGERDWQFDGWLRQMKTQQKQLMTAYVGQDTSGRLQQSFPHSPEFLRFVTRAVASYKTAPSMYV
ncbi:MAG: hypothetical protein L6R38_001412 [Xanthoria sp. 2 TBL-2021]|nr:MAG: hypothetical protein L6R38_001412 [Xanthoria sp. 2 TBL-2021]